MYNFIVLSFGNLFFSADCGCACSNVMWNDYCSLSSQPALQKIHCIFYTGKFTVKMSLPIIRIDSLDFKLESQSFQLQACDLSRALVNRLERHTEAKDKFNCIQMRITKTV